MNTLEYSRTLEVQWKQSLPRLHGKKLFEFFPDAKTILETKIKELEQLRKKLTLEIQSLLKKQNEYQDEFSRWAYREGIKIHHVSKLLNVESHLKRMKILVSISNNKTPGGYISEEQKAQALSVPIEGILNDRTFRKSGKNIVTNCPLHEDHSPSFYVYTKTNTCWCFGCNQGGDSIKLVRLLFGYSFKEAVQYLL